ncbi:MAG TPA: ABC transporter ATP-binding protein [Anaerolineales bacterium]|nr:ABC transporter ATP-binding protein [Anaerolineales bacterium]
MVQPEQIQEHEIPEELARPLSIKTSELTKTFGGEVAVNAINLEVPEGAIFGFIGPSGSGKTTTIRLLMGLYQPDGGEVSVMGVPPTQFSRHDRERIGYLPQLFVLYPDLTVWENMNFAASLYGVPFLRTKRLNELLDLVELREDRHKLVRNISGGMRRRLSLAATLVHNPDLLFLDEPTAGIDPILRNKFWDYFKQLQSHARTLFVTTQYVSEAAYCDFVGVMSEGRLLSVNTPEGLRREAYGGDIVKVGSTERIDYEFRQEIQNLPELKSRILNTTDYEMQLLVDDAATATPYLVEYFRDRRASINSIEGYFPSYDDVFVRLIEKHRAENE